MKNNKKVAIVIPIYNVEKYLEECLESVVNQSYKNLEIILVNDGSTDENSFKIAKVYALKDSRITLFDKENGGQSTARNVGIEYLSGDYELEFQKEEQDFFVFKIKNENPLKIYNVYKSKVYFENQKKELEIPKVDYLEFVDSDDFIELNCVEECVKRMQGVEVVWFDWHFLNPTQAELNFGSRMQKYKFKRETIITNKDFIKRSYDIRFNHKVFVFSVSGMIDFNYLKNINLKFKIRTKHEDMLFGTLLFIQARKIYVCPKAFYYYRIHADSTSNRFKQLTKIYPKFLKSLAQCFDNDSTAIDLYYSSASYIDMALEFIEFSNQHSEDIDFLILLYDVILPFLYKSSSLALTLCHHKDPWGIISNYITLLTKIKIKEKNEDNIEVSLVIPAYNADKYIKWTLQSVLNQTFKNFECIIVNDCSQDKTINVIQETIKDDLRFKIINHKENGGLSSARNTGLRYAKGEYVAFLDADDLLTPNSLGKRKEVLDIHKKDSHIIGVYCKSTSIKEDCKALLVENKVALPKVSFMSSGGKCPFNANQPMFKTAILKKIGGFDETLRLAEDYDMWMRILRRGYCFMPVEFILTGYRQHHSSGIRTNPIKHLEISTTLFNNAHKNEIFEKINPKLSTGFIKDFNYYFFQNEKTLRVLNFVGMALANGDDNEKLLEILKQEIPDFFLINDFSYEKEVLYGINRYLNSSFENKEKLDLDLKNRYNKLYNDFYRYCLAKNNDENFILQNNKRFLNEKEKMDMMFNITQYPKLQEQIDIIFIPHKDYHTHAIKLLEPYLKEHNISFIILNINYHYRDEKAISAAQKYNLPFVNYGNFIFGNFKPKALVVFNDWESVTRAIVLAAEQSKIPTIGIVEGIQDYLDADTKRNRKAYQMVSYLILPGKHDEKYFKNSAQKLYIGGVPRIYNMYHSYKKKGFFENKKVALINSNFSYGVLVEHRDNWLKNAVESCLEAGYKVVITRHSKDIGKLYPDLVTDKSFYEILQECDVFVSRFASGILEALAANKLPVYFNPHREKVDKFTDSLGAYPIANSKEELIKILDNLEMYYHTCPKYFYDFLQYHCGSLEHDSSQLIVEYINEIIKQNNSPDYDNFFKKLFEIDSQTDCLCDTNKLIDVNLRTINIMNKNSKLEILLYENIKKGDYKIAKNYLDIVTHQNENPIFDKIQELNNIFIDIENKHKRG